MKPIDSYHRAPWFNPIQNDSIGLFVRKLFCCINAIDSVIKRVSVRLNLSLRAFMTRQQLLLIYPLIMLMTGCAINDKGFTQLRHFENETSYMTTQKTWGGFISTQNSDRGLTLGHTERIKVYPKLTKNAQLPIDEFLQQVDSNDFVEISNKETNLENLQPFAWIEKNYGLMFHTNPIKIGFSAGIESRSVLRLPPDFEGVFIINRDQNGTVKAGVQGELQRQ
jgi:hypothetical protein